jgi:hypothetical protein
VYTQGVPRSAPLYQTSDDARAFRQESDAHERARFVCELLMRCTGAWPRLELEDLRYAARVRATALAHFAGLTRIARDQWGQSWQPSRILERAIKRHGLSLAEVEEHARGL